MASGRLICREPSGQTFGRCFMLFSDVQCDHVTSSFIRDGYTQLMRLEGKTMMYTALGSKICTGHADHGGAS